MTRQLPLLVCLEGIMGAGKTSVMRCIEEKLSKKSPDFTIGLAAEPDNAFQCYHSPSRGKAFNPLYWSYKRREAKPVTQMHIIDCVSSHFYSLFQVKNEDVLITERGPQSPLYFIEHYINTGVICSYVEAFLRDYWEQKNADNVTEPDLIVFLDVLPNVCLERLRRRGRGGEEEVTLLDLQSLRQSHLTCMAKVSCPVIIVAVEEHHSAEKVADDVLKRIIAECDERLQLVREL